MNETITEIVETEVSESALTTFNNLAKYRSFAANQLALDFNTDIPTFSDFVSNPPVLHIPALIPVVRPQFFSE